MKYLLILLLFGIVDMLLYKISTAEYPFLLKKITFYISLNSILHSY